MICRHVLDRFFAENSVAVEHAAITQRDGKSHVVDRGRDKTNANRIQRDILEIAQCGAWAAWNSRQFASVRV